jgi:PadR family transcriptional regulator AphA
LISIVTDDPLYPPNRDPERLQLIFSDLTSVDNVRRHLEAHLRHSIDLRDTLRPILDRIVDGKHERVQKRLSTMPPQQRALTLLLRELAYGGDIERAELEVAWAQRALRALDEYERRYVEVDEVPPLQAQDALD